MRAIGSISNEAQARRFGDYLVAKEIRNQIEIEEGNEWTIWIYEEDDIAPAKAAFDKFLASPDAEEFCSASSAAAKVREAEARDLAEYRRRVRTRKSLFPKLGGYGVGAVTFSLIFLCVAVAAYSKLGYDPETLKPLLLADPENANRTFLPEVRAGDYWRLISPIFIHFGPLHLLFNMMWLYQLGCMIEARRGATQFALLVAATGVLPMIAQYIVSGPGYVGGMSGVVYGLAGYVWMRGKYDRASGVFLDSRSIQWLLIWLIVCFTGAVGRIANTAHVTGLILGIVWGRVSAYIASRRAE